MKPEIGIPYDSRNDLGYGRTKEKFHKQRSRAQSYPYPDADDFDSDSVDDVLSDEEASKLIKKIPTMGYQITDPHNDASTDKFYYAAGNTKLSDCFARIDQVLAEVEATGKSINPVPGLHKGKNVMLGTQQGRALYIRSGSPVRTGTYKGWSKAHIPYEDESIEDEDHPNTLQDLINLMLDEE